MSSWWQARDSSSWESQNQWQSGDWSKQTWQESHWDNQSSSIQSSAPVLPSTFAPDHLHYDKTPVGKGCHVLHRCVQPTKWSRKTGIAGRDVADIRAFELSHRGLGDFSFRLLPEGRHQSIVWARSGSESVLLAALLKKIRESGISIDEAAQACHSAAVPDKHKEAMRFMEPLAQPAGLSFDLRLVHFYIGCSPLRRCFLSSGHVVCCGLGTWNYKASCQKLMLHHAAYGCS